MNTSGAFVATSTLPDASAVTAAGPCATVTVLASMPASSKKPCSTATSTSVVTSVFGCTVKRTVIGCASARVAVGRSSARTASDAGDKPRLPRRNRIDVSCALPPCAGLRIGVALR